MARLRQSHCDGPGIRRRRRGRGFSYHWDDGTAVTDTAHLDRIRTLAVPPAWTEVWICPWPHGHIQAIGTDAAGRRQYRYHDAWREKRDKEKFDRILRLGQRLPAVRRAVGAHLLLDGMPEERALATAVRLLDVASMRIGGEEYASDNETYGLATLLRSHVRVEGRDMTFHFRAKAGQDLTLLVTDERAASAVQALKVRRGGGPELLAWRETRRWVDVRSDDVNAFIKDLAGPEFSAKDFRTWNATVLAAKQLAALDATASSEAARRRAVNGAVKVVAKHLGNTPAVCRSAYIDPRAIEHFHRGETITLASPRAGRRSIEQAVLRLLTSDFSKRGSALTLDAAA